MNEQEYKEFIEQQKNESIKARVFRHKATGEYTTQINIFHLNEYDEVES